MSEIPEMKSCPFCGSQCEIYHALSGIVSCSNEKCDVTPIASDAQNWNRRAPDREQIRYALIQSDWGRNPYTPFTDLDAAVETIASGWEKR